MVYIVSMKQTSQTLAAVARDVALKPDAAVVEVAVGSHLVGLQLDTGAMGLCSLLPGVTDVDGYPPCESALQLARAFLMEGRDQGRHPTLGMASVNGLLPVPDAARPLKAQDLILQHGEGRRVVVVGHFPFVEKMGERFGSFHVLERRPREGDLDASMAGEVIPRADVVAITGTTLLNGTLDGLLELCNPDAFVLLMGPSTPFAGSLFDCGVDVLAGARVVDSDQACADIRAGKPFKQLSGVEVLVWGREDAGRA